MRSSVSLIPVAAGSAPEESLCAHSESDIKITLNVMYPQLRMDVSTNDDGVPRLKSYVLLRLLTFNDFVVVKRQAFLSAVGGLAQHVD